MSTRTTSLHDRPGGDARPRRRSTAWVAVALLGLVAGGRAGADEAAPGPTAAASPGAATDPGTAPVTSALRLVDVRGAAIDLADLRHRGWLVAVRPPERALAAAVAAVPSTCAALDERGASLLVLARARARDLHALGAGLPCPLVPDRDGATWRGLGAGARPGVLVLDPAHAVRARLPWTPDWDARVCELVAALQATTPAVDLRPAYAHFGLGVRRQGRRGTCSVFTAVGALELALAIRRGAGAPLSVEFLNWAANQATGHPEGDGQFFHNCIRGFERHGVARDASMPYARAHDPARAPSEAALAEGRAARAEGLRFRWLKPIGTPKGAMPAELQACREVLARGLPVAAGSYHSVLFVGYETGPEHPGGGRFVTHDSGAGAARHMSFEEAAGRLNDLFWVQATPRPWWEAP